MIRKAIPLAALVLLAACAMSPTLPATNARTTHLSRDTGTFGGGGGEVTPPPPPASGDNEGFLGSGN